ncbi:MAG: FHA domain-containing protein [Planctomycetota bacterium]
MPGPSYGGGDFSPSGSGAHVDRSTSNGGELSVDSGVDTCSDSSIRLPATSTSDGDAVTSTYTLGIFDDHLRSFPIVPGTLVVGRSKRSHLQLHDHLLSRKHCSLTYADGVLTLVDLNSANGTFVNGERVATRQLQHDDLVELGRTVMVVFDGTSWNRGEGLLNLRNPMKAQELVQRLGDGSAGERGNGGAELRAPLPGAPRNGVRPKKGLDDRERAFLHWLEQGESRLLPPLVTDYLAHKLVSLLVRNSMPIRSAFTTVLEEMLRPEFFQRFDDFDEMKTCVAELIERELSDLREDPDPEPDDRGLLEDERES